MDQQQYKWTIGIIRDRYHRLELTYEQAEKVHEFESLRDAHLLLFSPWEMWDYESSAFQEFLTETQFAKFKTFQREAADQYVQDLAESDELKSQELEMLADRRRFITEEFLPDLVDQSRSAFAVTFKEDGPKIAYLQAEYTAFLIQRKMEMIAEHFRFNRTFMPVTLQVALTAHALNAILPQYASFESKMDAPTRKVSRFLKQKPRYFPKHFEELVIKKLDEFHAFNLMAIEKRFQADKQIGSVWVAERDKPKERENLVLSLLLLYEQ